MEGHNGQTDIRSYRVASLLKILPFDFICKATVQKATIPGSFELKLSQSRICHLQLKGLSIIELDQKKTEFFLSKYPGLDLFKNE